MPSWKTLRRYLERNGWELDRATGDLHYIKGGRRIKCSNSSKEISFAMWRTILKKELQITQAEFNEGLK